MPDSPHIKPLHIAFPPQLHEALRVAAFTERCTMSEVVRRACTAYIAERPAPKEAK